MDVVALAKNEGANFRRIHSKLLEWEIEDSGLAPLTAAQEAAINTLTFAMKGVSSQEPTLPEVIDSPSEEKLETFRSKSYEELGRNGDIDNTNSFLFWGDRVDNEISSYKDQIHSMYFLQLEECSRECDKMFDSIKISRDNLNTLKSEYEFISNKTNSLNEANEKLIQEQNRLKHIDDEIQARLHYFTQVEQLSRRLQSTSNSVASDSFHDCLSKIDECLFFLQRNEKLKDAPAFIARYKQLLSKAVLTIRNYISSIITSATEQILSSGIQSNLDQDAAFAIYYGKFQTSAVKVKRISAMVEERVNRISDYEQLLSEMHNCYFTERANVMLPAVHKSIMELKSNNKGDYCVLTRSACAFLVHVCQDEHRLFYQFFSVSTNQLHSYLEGLCTVLYDTLRPYIIHINHLETLAEICSILRVEMIEEHVNQNAEPLEAFGRIASQLLQDAQERLVFRTHLYLQSDILNYNPSAGDLAYPDKLKMMENIALSLQESALVRSDSKSSIGSNVTEDTDHTGGNRSHPQTINSPADLHGMWYPTVRRTLICLSRLYRCVDRVVFQGLSQEAVKCCIQSISKAASQICSTKTPMDGQLFEIKHLLILREQIAPFRTEFTVKETSLDFSKVKTAAFELLHKRKQLFSLGTNNALLEFLLDGTPQVKEHLIDSRKDVDKQLKLTCEQFISHAVNMFVGSLMEFTEKANAFINDCSKSEPPKSTFALRQCPWASPQQINVLTRKSQRIIKNDLSALQRSMKLYLSNKDTEFVIFRLIRNNIINAFIKLEQLLTTNGYSAEDMLIVDCPSAEQISVLISSANILADSQVDTKQTIAKQVEAQSEKVLAEKTQTKE
ncbi:unnamed protein product [Hermetia illucens]|uniref:Conserved oligomeric Golgi complex subunit 3 n=1 Tax=Hermetia illucens TaxID=343691 RepID=A0A7R8UK72_HERIL|nr:conserved oligomeric Golgi complex subunit 3 [Hermetia illucens]CAD7082047.1 unnamed protein product [Hermetia illucens]